ncbi:MAG: type II toxin-antitoxin system RelE/ParE family toxin [Candidatus Brocadia sp.]|nr:MAG: type II toxin-antitoxin system RelE/ParE family toxin [Candidatus Brocadia sp.]
MLLCLRWLSFYEKLAECPGIFFWIPFFSDIDSLIVIDGIQSLIFWEIHHRMLSKRFPIAIYYRVENRTALVFGVLDCCRSPAWVKKKLKQKGRDYGTAT